MNIQINEDILWQKYTLGNTTIFFKGYIYSHTTDELLKKIKDIKKINYLIL